MPSSGDNPARLLVIGYGNTLRRDDGVGPRVAGAVKEMQLPGVQVLAPQQLVPELAAHIARARAVIFVDAIAEKTERVELRELAVGPDCPDFTHAGDPSALLALVKHIYGNNPPGWILAIPGEDFAFGETLSPCALHGSELAVTQIVEQARYLNNPPGEKQ